MTFHITRRRMVGTGLAAGAGLTLPLPALAQGQAWPNKPIKFIVTFPPGGLTDLFARAYGDYISNKLGQPVLVENKTGAGGIVGAQAVKAAAADGYTLMFTIATTLIMNRVTYKTLPYDADKDFVLISSMTGGGLIFALQKSLGLKTLPEFFEHSKKNKVTYGTYAAGSGSHIIIAELNKHYGANIEVVHYRGEGPMWQDFNAGVIQAACGSYPATKNILDGGSAVPVAVWSPKRMRKLAEVPTFQELGLKSKVFDLQGFIGLVGPTGMPQEAVNKLSDLMVEAGKSERVAKLLETYGIDEAAQGKDHFRKLYDFEKPIWLELVTSLGLTPQ
jgi:tripartite-type tricarboxylate transporter receptor subunit TctC